MSSTGSVDGDATLRLFLALQLPGEVRAALASWAAAGLGGVRLVRSEDLHITLAFLGTRPRDELPRILGALRGAATDAGPMALTPLRWRETRTVGMAVLGDEGGAAGELAQDLHHRLERLGVYEPERRKWLPHVTVARWRDAPRRRLPPPPGGTFVPSGAAAYISRLHPSGARYEVLESVVLAGEKPVPRQRPVGGVTP